MNLTSTIVIIALLVAAVAWLVVSHRATKAKLASLEAAVTADTKDPRAIVDAFVSLTKPAEAAPAPASASPPAAVATASPAPAAPPAAAPAPAATPSVATPTGRTVTELLIAGEAERNAAALALEAAQRAASVPQVAAVIEYRTEWDVDYAVLFNRNYHVGPGPGRVRCTIPAGTKIKVNGCVATTPGPQPGTGTRYPYGSTVNGADPMSRVTDAVMDHALVVFGATAGDREITGTDEFVLEVTQPADGYAVVAVYPVQVA